MLARAGSSQVGRGTACIQERFFSSAGKRVASELGPIDILVNNAGKLAKGDLSDFDYTQMEAMRRTNVDGLVQVTRAVVDGMKSRGFGRIVNLTSVAAFGTAFSGTTFYAATKAAVVVMTRRFALDLGPFGITAASTVPPINAEVTTLFDCSGFTVTSLIM